MREPLTLTGMILSAAPIGEYDKRVVVLTKERGKIHAFARGARKPNSSLLAAANPFCFGQFSFYEGRDSYTMIQAEVQNYFRELSLDFEGAYYGFYFLEVADYYTRENNDEAEMLKLLYVTLRALTNPHLDRELVRTVFELRSMVVNGEYPEVFSCVECRSQTELAAFVPKRDGLVCRSCAGRYQEKYPLLESTVYTLQYVISAPVQKLYTFTLKPEVQKEFQKITARFRRKYVDKKFKSLDILQSILNIS
jgi:DNA repair protein RecO (recombination protein O)